MTESGAAAVTDQLYRQTTVEFFSFLLTDKSASHHYTAKITVSFITSQSQDLESLKSNIFNEFYIPLYKLSALSNEF